METLNQYGTRFFSECKKEELETNLGNTNNGKLLLH